MNPKKPGPEMPWGNPDKTPQENKDDLYAGPDVDTETFKQALQDAGGVVVEPENVDDEEK